MMKGVEVVGWCVCGVCVCGATPLQSHGAISMCVCVCVRERGSMWVP